LEKNNEDDNVEIVEDLKRGIKVNIRVYYCRQGEILRKCLQKILKSAKTVRKNLQKSAKNKIRKKCPQKFSAKIP